MKEREIARRLTQERPPVPPGLAARIKSEIPQELVVSPEGKGRADLEEGQTGWWRDQKWVLAASVVLLLGATLLTLRLRDLRPVASPGASEPVWEGRATAPTPESPPEAAATAEDQPAVAASEAASPVEAVLGSEEADEERAKSGRLRARVPAPLQTRPQTQRVGQTVASSDENRQTDLAMPGERQAAPSRASAARRSEQEALASRLKSAQDRDRQERADPAAERVAEPEVELAFEADMEVSGAGRPLSARSRLVAPSAAEDPRLGRGLGTPAPGGPLRAPSPPPRPAPSPEPSFGDRPAPPGEPSPGVPRRGRAAPNDAPFDDMFYGTLEVNPFVDTEDDAFSTFGLDVDTGSYTLARRYLNQGHLPHPASVRVEEFVNFFDYGDPPPLRGDFGLYVEGAPSPFAQGPRYHVLRFGLRAREMGRQERRPALLTFLVDVSGSMAQGNRLGLVKEALALLVDELRPDDRMALVAYNERAQVLLEPTGDRQAILRALDGLSPAGSTHLEVGLVQAYELAARFQGAGLINRVVLCSDGVANVGRTGAESLLSVVRRQAAQGVELTTVGVGLGNYNDLLMEQLADRGNGRYAYVDTLAEARRIFVEHLTGSLQTLAADAKVQVEFNPRVVARYRLLGYENRGVADPSFRDDDTDGGEIGVGHRVTVLYEIKLHPEAPRREPLATFTLRYGSMELGEVVEVEREIRPAHLVKRWQDASKALRLASLVAEFAEILRGSYWAREGDLDGVFRRAQSLLPEFPGRTEVAELVSLVGKARDLRWAAQDLPTRKQVPR